MSSNTRHYDRVFDEITSLYDIYDNNDAIDQMSLSEIIELVNAIRDREAILEALGEQVRSRWSRQRILTNVKYNSDQHHHTGGLTTPEEVARNKKAAVAKTLGKHNRIEACHFRLRLD
tara:strand:+ start:425 stop:778 length:354 start_codon:yes stop_codon:yes gene_type:complete